MHGYIRKGKENPKIELRGKQNPKKSTRVYISPRVLKELNDRDYEDYDDRIAHYKTMGVI